MEAEKKKEDDSKSTASKEEEDEEDDDAEELEVRPHTIIKEHTQEIVRSYLLRSISVIKSSSRGGANGDIAKLAVGLLS
eukprot:5488810-Amphidinium_carterae.2